jgi:hypoxanthine phosphoribosyltransferase
MSLRKDPHLTEFIDQKTIAERVKELGASIKAHYEPLKEPLVLVGVLKGSIIFLADLARAIDMPLEMEMMGVSSYGEATTSSGAVRITQDLVRPITDKHVLVVEDILDTGLTLKYLMENLNARNPKSIKSCTLLKKETPNQADIKTNFVGFVVPNKFVVGYGLDLAERYRNLPMIAIYNPAD